LLLEFLLGEKILAAPVIEKDKYERDIYLPVGTWKDGNNGKVYEGKQWIKNYPAPIGVLPYFIRQESEVKKIEFGNSNFWISIQQRKEDNQYVLEVYNGKEIR
jgi:alpha-glucosidase (family GH31 glycosyl hydrolase)